MKNNQFTEVFFYYKSLVYKPKYGWCENFYIEMTFINFANRHVEHFKSFVYNNINHLNTNNLQVEVLHDLKSQCLQQIV